MDNEKKEFEAPQEQTEVQQEPQVEPIAQEPQVQVEQPVVQEPQEQQPQEQMYYFN